MAEKNKGGLQSLVGGKDDDKKTRGLWEMFMDALEEKKTVDTGKFKREFD